jgi:hypothetical protein
VTDFLNGQPPYNVDHMAYLSAALSSHDYARRHMDKLPRFEDRAGILRHAARQIDVDGLILEFGVFQGATINILADERPQDRLYGFDSFEGLPEDWTPGAPAGHFNVDTLPHVRDNVELVRGWFDRSLPPFLEQHGEKAALIHIDCDLYSSTQVVLAQLRDRICSGTVIVFDEYFNYPGWDQHEFLAWQEFVARYDIKYRYIALVPQYEQVALKVL